MTKRIFSFPSLALTFITVFFAAHTSPLHAESRVSIGVGINHYSGQFGRHSSHSGPSYVHPGGYKTVILGHRSFGLHHTPRRYNCFQPGYRRHAAPRNHFISPHFKYPQPRYNTYRRHSGFSLNVIAPIIYSISVPHSPAPSIRQSPAPLTCMSTTP